MRRREKNVGKVKKKKKNKHTNEKNFYPRNCGGTYVEKSWRMGESAKQAEREIWKLFQEE